MPPDAPLGPPDAQPRPPDAPLRAAVVGVGAMGRRHARIYRDLRGATLVGVADTNLSRAGEAGRDYLAPYYGGVEEMLRVARPEIVSVAVPTRSHFEVASRCLEAGCHVLVEKPIAATVGEGRRLLELAASAGRKLTVGLVERFNPAVIELERRLATGQAGRIVYMASRRLGPPPRAPAETGVIMDLATHDIDVMLRLGGGAVVAAHADSRTIRGPYEDCAIILLRFAGGAIGLVEVSRVTPTKVRELWVTGEEGLFVLDYITQDLSFYEGGPSDEPGAGWDFFALLRGGPGGAMVKYGIRKAEPLAVELAFFVESVRRGDYDLSLARSAVDVLEVVQSLVAGR